MNLECELSKGIGLPENAVEMLNRVNWWLWKRKCWRHRKTEMKMDKVEVPCQMASGISRNSGTKGC